MAEKEGEIAYRLWRKYVELELVFYVPRGIELGHNVRSPELAVLVDSASEAKTDVGGASPYVLRKVARIRRGHGVVVVIQVSLELCKKRIAETTIIMYFSQRFSLCCPACSSLHPVV